MDGGAPIPAAFLGEEGLPPLVKCLVRSSTMTAGRHPAANPPSPGGSEKFAAVGSRFPAKQGLIELSVDCAVSPGWRAQAGKSLVFSAACQGHTNAV